MNAAYNTTVRFASRIASMPASKYFPELVHEIARLRAAGLEWTEVDAELGMDRYFGIPRKSESYDLMKRAPARRVLAA